MEELLINGNDAWSTYGVKMGQGFIDTLESGLSLKDFVTNSSRLEHGIRIVAEAQPKIASREITLSFRIHGEGDTLDVQRASFARRKKNLENTFLAGNVTISVPRLSADVYNLVYVGGSPSYSHNAQRTAGTISVKFIEPNPSNRK